MCRTDGEVARWPPLVSDLAGADHADMAHRQLLSHP